MQNILKLWDFGIRTFPINMYCWYLGYCYINLLQLTLTCLPKLVLGDSVYFSSKKDRKYFIQAKIVMH